MVNNPVTGDVWEFPAPAPTSLGWTEVLRNGHHLFRVRMVDGPPAAIVLEDGTCLTPEEFIEYLLNLIIPSDKKA